MAWQFQSCVTPPLVLSHCNVCCSSSLLWQEYWTIPKCQALLKQTTHNSTCVIKGLFEIFFNNGLYHFLSYPMQVKNLPLFYFHPFHTRTWGRIQNYAKWIIYKGKCNHIGKRVNSRLRESVLDNLDWANLKLYTVFHKTQNGTATVDMVTISV